MTTNRSELELGNGERLPWLETAADYDERQRRSWGMVLAVLAGLAALALVIGAIWYTQRDRVTAGDGERIAAPEGDYKTRADGTDGMNVGNESEAMLATSDGQEARGRIAAAPEPLATSTADAKTKTASAASTQPASVPAPAAHVATGSAVQLGALDDQASAEMAWAKLKRSHRGLASLSHSVERVEAGGKSVYRLRAAVADPAAARALCGTLQSAGVACFAVR